MSIIKALREGPEPLTVAELAALLRVTESTVQKWVRNRQIPSIRIGDVIRFDGAVLCDWIELEGGCTRPTHPRTTGNPDEDRVTWQNLEELATAEEFQRPKEKK